MKNFKIYADGETYQEPAKHSFFTAGTQVLFEMIDGQIRSRIRIPVQFA